jgi:hypothetical protein
MDILNDCYVLKPSVAIEDFDNESLIFLPEERRLIKINAVARDILKRLDGKRTIYAIANELALSYMEPCDLLLNDVFAVLSDLAAQSVVKEVNRLKTIKDFQCMKNTKYSINHDVSCRIEEPEGAVLFNPETDAVQVINPTGLAIWQALEFPKTKQEIVEYLLDVCEDVPEDQVVQDVEEFIERLNAAGFIGEIVE